MSLELWLLTGVYGLAALALVVAVAACTAWRDTELLAHKHATPQRPDGCTCGWGWPRRQATWHARRCGLYVRQPKREG